MKKILIALGAVVGVVVIAAVLVPLLVPAEKVKEQIVAQVKTATGRDLMIGGDVGVSVFPSLAVKVADVSLSSPPGFTAKNLVHLGALDLSLKIMPLLSGNIEVDSFVLVDPTFALEVDAKGRNNWTFETSGGASSSSSSSTSGADFLKNVRLGDVGIENGKLTYTDAASGAAQALDAMNIKIAMNSLDEPLALDGSFDWRKQKIALALEVQNPRVVLAGAGETPLTLSVKADPIAVSLKGAFAGADQRVTGDVDVASPSVRNLAAWTTGTPLDVPGTGLGPLAIKGRVSAAAGAFAFTNASITLDAIASKGEVEVKTSGARPMITGKLDVGMLDLNPYLPPPAPSAQQAWSDAPIDASGLRAADADLALSAAGMKIRNINVGQSAVTLRLRNGRLTTTLSQLAFYGGSGSGSVVLDGSQAALGIEASFAMKGLQAEPFLTDAADFKRLSGTGNTDIEIAGRGRSQREIIASLSGKGSTSFTDGAIKGIDIPGMVRNVTSAFTAKSEAQKTDFAELSGSYTIANGILTNQDMILQAPVLRVSGAGTVDLPQQTLKYRVEPKVAGTLQGQGGKADVAGLMVPVMVEGPWNNLSYKPDLAAAAKAAASKAVGGFLGGALPGGESGSKAPSLKSLLPGFGAPK